MAFQYFCLIDLIFFLLDIISKIFLFHLLILLQHDCQLLIGIEKEQDPKTNILFRNIFPRIQYPLYRSLHIDSEKLNIF